MVLAAADKSVNLARRMLKSRDEAAGGIVDEIQAPRRWIQEGQDPGDAVSLSLAEKLRMPNRMTRF